MMSLFRFIFIPLVLEFFDFIHAPICKRCIKRLFYYHWLSPLADCLDLDALICPCDILKGLFTDMLAIFIHSCHCSLHWLIETRKFRMPFLKMDAKRNVSQLSFVHLATFRDVQCATAASLSVWQITSRKMRSNWNRLISMLKVFCLFLAGAECLAIAIRTRENCGQRRSLSPEALAVLERACLNGFLWPSKSIHKYVQMISW